MYKVKGGFRSFRSRRSFIAAAITLGLFLVTLPLGMSLVLSQSRFFSKAAAGCIRKNPVAEISPFSKQGKPGETLAFTVNVTNADTANCPASVFKPVLYSLTPGWSMVIDPPGGMTIWPQATAGFGVRVTSLSNAKSNGFYGFTIKMNNASVSGYSSYATANYEVQASAKCTTHVAPTLTIKGDVEKVGRPGESVLYDLEITNDDSISCPTSTFYLKPNSQPNGWQIPQLNINIQPGEKKAVRLSITSLSTAQAGVYTISLVANNVSGSSTFPTIKEVRYRVGGSTFTGCTRIKPTLELVPSTTQKQYGQGSQFSVYLVNNDSQYCPVSEFPISVITPSPSWIATLNIASPIKSGPSTRTSGAIYVIAPKEAVGKANKITIVTANAQIPEHTAYFASDFIVTSN